MDQCEYSKPSTGLEKHILDLDNYTHNEIAKIYNYIDSKIIIFLQNNTQSINELQNRVCNMEDKLQQATQLCELKCNDVIAIKRQIDSLKIQENDESIKLRNTLDEKDTQKSEKKANLSESSTSTSYLDDIEFLKSELKNIKEQLNSSPFSNQKIYLESDEEIPHHMKEESYEVNSNILTIPSRITQIISQTLNSADQSSANIILEFSDSTESAEESSQSFNEREIELAPVASEETLFGTSNEDEIKFNELSQKVEQLIQENDSLKKDVAALKQASAMSGREDVRRDQQGERGVVHVSRGRVPGGRGEREGGPDRLRQQQDERRHQVPQESDSVDLLDDKLDIFAEKVAQVSAKIKRLKAEGRRGLRPVKADVAALRQEVERLKDWRRQEEEKPQRRFGRRKKASTILI
ncbi:hypothetical protein M9Y10_039768 [Tritrichomonas musculus]|uniref:Uncharacterized protein n=1 Tax=Tritrichomonas musculus TaxID=1915356 RepID=A0ABR2GR70_9EUKA